MISPDGYDALIEGAGLIERSDRGRLRLTGGDRRTYLQGILTNEIAALTPGTGCYAAMLTPNGRMISDMRVLELGESLLLDLGSAATASMRDRLDQFIFTEDVTVSDVSGALAQVGIYGPRSAVVLAKALPGVDASALDSLPLFHNIAVGGPVIIAASDDFGINGFEVFVDTAARDGLVEALNRAGAVPVGRDAVEITRVEAGRPLFGVDMDADTIPLEAGIEDRAISHTKGCYVGQEIIIRVLHRGHGRVARRLVGLNVEGPRPERGDRISAGEREVGIVTSAVQSPRVGHPVALGYVRREQSEPGTALTISGAQGTSAATVVSLPFVLQPSASR